MRHGPLMRHGRESSARMDHWRRDSQTGATRRGRIMARNDAWTRGFARQALADFERSNVAVSGSIIANIPRRMSRAKSMFHSIGPSTQRGSWCFPQGEPFSSLCGGQLADFCELSPKGRRFRRRPDGRESLPFLSSGLILIPDCKPY